MTEITDLQIIDMLRDETEVRSQTEIKHKLVLLVTIVTLCALSLFILSPSDSAQYKIMSAGAAINSAAFFVYWLYLLFQSTHLHSIRIITARMKPFYGSMVFPTQIEQFPLRPIKSMSEMLALRGSSIHIWFVTMGNLVGCITATAITLNWLDLHRNARLSDKELNINYVEQAFAICAAVSQGLIGSFDLNVYSRWHVYMHYVGVLCMVLGVWPFVIQSKWSMLSIAITSVTYIALIAWTCLWYYYPSDLSDGMGRGQGVEYQKVQRKVHVISLQCLLSETVGAIGCSLALCLYLWNIEDTYS